MLLIFSHCLVVVKSSMNSLEPSQFFLLIFEDIHEPHLCWKNLCLPRKCYVNDGGSHFSTLLKCCACNPQCENLIDCQQLPWFGCSFRSPPSNCSKARYIHTQGISSGFLLLLTARWGVSNQGLDSLQQSWNPLPMTHREQGPIMARMALPRIAFV